MSGALGRHGSPYNAAGSRECAPDDRLRIGPRRRTFVPDPASSAKAFAVIAGSSGVITYRQMSAFGVEADQRSEIFDFSFCPNQK
jgi:hypothetical protein